MRGVGGRRFQEGGQRLGQSSSLTGFSITEVITSTCSVVVVVLDVVVVEVVVVVVLDVVV